MATGRLAKLTWGLAFAYPVVAAAVAGVIPGIDAGVRVSLFLGGAAAGLALVSLLIAVEIGRVNVELTRLSIEESQVLARASMDLQIALAETTRVHEARVEELLEQIASALDGGTSRMPLTDRLFRRKRADAEG